MIICQSTAVASALAVTEKARCAVAQHSFDQVGTVTASFGVSELTSRDDIFSFLARTDKALYLVKTMRNNSAFL